MKIVHLCLSSFYIDDYSYQENMLPKYHMKMGYDVTVIASLVSFNSEGKPCFLPQASEYYSKDGYKVVRLDYKKSNYKFNKFIRIYEGTMEVLKREKPDILFIHDYSFMDIVKVMNYAKENNIKVYIDCHTDYINSAKSWMSKYVFHHTIWRYIGKKIAPHVKMFYGVTPLRCSFLRDAYRIPQDKIKLLEMGLDDEIFKEKIAANNSDALRSKIGVNNDDFVVLTGGKIDILKNIHLVLEAFKNIHTPKVKLVVFGTIAPEILDYINGLLKSPNVIFVGWLSADQILDYFIMADLIVFPGTHSVLWEQAVGTGTPTIYKYWDEMTHMDIGGNCMFLKEDSAEEIEKTLQYVLQSPDIYNKMKIAAEGGLSKFAYSSIAKRSLA
ncbi:glycosyltransferase family 4 protein [Chryseobacterium arthrosphaerae]|uniref:Glycosyltransferase family 4 protein n=2 Tax=Chryseobacterium arthrosphaerae TaxID=651561 RepID=A0A1B8ZTS9_9FLAO|nr:glycosyltransferase family 4 protein [Chryseobacterium arthrosphaerae]AYZ13427.1 glycosyltransferase [Chryseobacterium arthrosphaerae]OCA74997.1 hypothetical protein BBI00_11925 [Chryseobacterium arthrosphaerae]